MYPAHCEQRHKGRPIPTRTVPHVQLYDDRSVPRVSVSKRLLSLDLGVTSGYAVHTLEGTLLGYGSFYADECWERMKELLHLHGLISYTVAEPPILMRGPYADALAYVLSRARITYDRQIQWVNPAQWKQTPVGKSKLPLELSPRPDQHARDAIRIGRWWLQYQGPSDSITVPG